jgi:hypothetical protein
MSETLPSEQKSSVLLQNIPRQKFMFFSNLLHFSYMHTLQTFQYLTSLTKDFESKEMKNET